MDGIPHLRGPRPRTTSHPDRPCVNRTDEHRPSTCPRAASALGGAARWVYRHREGQLPLKKNRLPPLSAAPAPRRNPSRTSPAAAMTGCVPPRFGRVALRPAPRHASPMAPTRHGGMPSALAGKGGAAGFFSFPGLSAGRVQGEGRLWGFGS